MEVVWVQPLDSMMRQVLLEHERGRGPVRALHALEPGLHARPQPDVPHRPFKVRARRREEVPRRHQVHQRHLVRLVVRQLAGRDLVVVRDALGLQLFDRKILNRAPQSAVE